MESQSNQSTQDKPEQAFKRATDNGIFGYMGTERAIELYNDIHKKGTLNLEWKFYGRREHGEQPAKELVDYKEQVDNSNDTFLMASHENNFDDTKNTEFDFDDEFGALRDESTLLSADSLQLKKRPEPGSERKTNLSEIMSDIMKESNADETT